MLRILSRGAGGFATAAVTAAMLTIGSGQAFAASQLVVDDDGMQCDHADFDTIGAAVGAAEPGSVIRVCPGRYAGSITVDKPLTLEGDPEAVEAIDCFDAKPSRLDELDPAEYVIVDGRGSSALDLFRLRADHIALEGFVLQGASSSPLPADTRFYRRAINTSAAYSGYRVHHNLIMANTVGAYFRSSGVVPSSFHHNCLRDNGWGLANQWLPLIDARIHHNSTFRTTGYAYEQSGNCPEFLETGGLDACLYSRIGMDHVSFEHNVSIGDDSAYRLASSTFTTLAKSTVISARLGVRLIGANEDLQIIDNRLEVRLTGLARPSTPPIPSNIRALIQGNTITGVSGTGAGIGMGVAGLKDSWILDNVISGLTGEGIVLLAGNTENLVRGNTVTSNGSYGIRATGATGNTFEDNELLGNGWRPGTDGVDARDDARESNVWRGNTCLTDFPDGTICGVY